VGAARPTLQLRHVQASLWRMAASMPLIHRNPYGCPSRSAMGELAASDSRLTPPPKDAAGRKGPRAAAPSPSGPRS
jgi:hypothetical protein